MSQTAIQDSALATATATRRRSPGLSPVCPARVGVAGGPAGRSKGSGGAPPMVRQQWCNARTRHISLA
eukprot:8087305-Alexandrium_andersonii.AAC.1